MSLLQEAFRDVTTAVEYVALSLYYRKSTADTQSVARITVLRAATKFSITYRYPLPVLSRIQRDNRIPIYLNSAIFSYNTPINQVKMRNYYGEN